VFPGPKPVENCESIVVFRGTWGMGSLYTPIGARSAYSIPGWFTLQDF